MIITIDGPVASGKSTVAKRLAQKLNFYYLNTGMLYRALAYLLVHTSGYTVQQLSDPREKDIDLYLDPHQLIYRYETDGTIRLFWQTTDLTPFLKTSEMDQASSVLSAHERVRARLLDFQRTFARKHAVVVEGRDTGSVVFPQAEVKFFLTASVAERALRWQYDQRQRGKQFSVPESVAQINERDARDTTRTHNPLIIPHGAIVIDSTGLTSDQVVEKMWEHVVHKV